MSGITQEELRDLLDYDPSTGLLHWKKKIARKIVVGQQAGCLGSDGYIRIRINGVLHLGHRVAWLHHYGNLPAIVDHRNLCRSDNRIINLRSANKSLNAMNSRSHRDAISTFKGVSWAKDKNKWHASICKGRKHFFLGYFDSEDEASQAYARASVLHHGEYGRI